MGSQQILLIVLSVILVGIAVSVGLSMFRSQAITSNQDYIILDIINLGSSAYQYKLRPGTFGGGSGSYEDYELPPGLEENENATYEIEVAEDGDSILIIGYSNTYEGAFIAARYEQKLNLITTLDDRPEAIGEGESRIRNGYLFHRWRDL